MFEALKGKWVVGVSGQNDSMALLSMCVKHQMDVVACIIDYQIRTSSKEEVNYVQSYCDKHNIHCEVIIAPHFSKNFQAKARDFRYRVFSQVVKKHNANGVLVAHHKDDHIETILWQLSRNHRVEHVGLQKETVIQDVLIKRVLLDVTKEQLLIYNKENNINFFEDESNLDTKYTRNAIRKKIASFSSKQKEEIILKAKQKNTQLKKIRSELQQLLQSKLDITMLLSLDSERQYELLWMYFSKAQYPYSISKKQLGEIVDQVRQNKIGMIPLRNNYVVYFQENKLELNEINNYNYEVTFDTIKNVKTKYFTCKSESDTLDGVCVLQEDFPITIRNFRAGDKIKCEFGHQKITTWFNQEKIPWFKRSSWPVIVNKNDEIIYVVGWRCDVNHSTNNPNLFVLK